ncbi:flagellar hook-length control protein FliK [Stutzerimonas stutzeri]|uniref:flagellar hook-length control protein FliK n=1 Tax=Stutzerimonas stutzeri TaxID=316 RepID=UPI001C2E1B8A|nr:flagellar hook-length control protein FliK [Stutzerimonas stutzeri]
MMIQSISATLATAANGEALRPLAARAGQGGQATTGRALAADPLRGFGERMRQASTADRDLSSELPAASWQGVRPMVAAEQGQVMQAGGTASQGSEQPQELTPEQWLLSMIDQQLAEIQARDAAQADAVPGLLPPALPDTVTVGADAPVAGSPEQDPFAQGLSASAPADPLSSLMPGSGAQRRTVELNPLAASLPTSAAEMGVGQAAGAATAPLEAASTAALEPLLEAAEPLDAGDPLAAAAERGQATPLQAADRALKLQAPEAKWGEQMLHALRENVDLQIQQKIQSATIRLDPPELGSMEILLSHESGRLNVHLSAANADVARLLQQTSDRLRQDLVGQHFVQVNVQVGADSGGQQGQPRQRPLLAGDEAPLAARPQEQAPERESLRARDVLVTV